MYTHTYIRLKACADIIRWNFWNVKKIEFFESIYIIIYIYNIYIYYRDYVYTRVPGTKYYFNG